MRVIGIVFLLGLLLTGSLSSVAQSPQGSTLITPANSADLVELERFGVGNLLDVAANPDGSYWVVGTTAGLWRVDGWTDDAPTTFWPIEGGAGTVAVSPDGRWVATNNWGDFRLWDMQQGREVYHWRNTDRWKWGGQVIAFSDHSQLVAWCDDRLHILDTASQQHRYAAYGAACTTLIFSHDSHFLYDLGYESWVIRWELGFRELIQHEWNPSANWMTMALSPDGQHLFAGAWHNELRDLDPATLETRHVWTDILDPYPITFSANGRWLLVYSRGDCCHKSGLFLWDTHTEQASWLFGTQNWTSPNLVTVTGNTILYLTYDHLYAIDIPTRTTTDLRDIIRDDEVRLYTRQGQPTPLEPDTLSSFRSTACRNRVNTSCTIVGTTILDGRTLVVLHLDGYGYSALQVLDTTTQAIHAFERGAVRDGVDMSADGHYLMGYPFVWDTVSGNLLADVRQFNDGSIGAINHARLTPDGQRIIVSSADAFYAITWATGEVVRFGEGQDFYANDPSMVISPDGRYLAITERGVSVFDLDTYERLWHVYEPYWLWDGLAFSPDGQMLAGTSFQFSEGRFMPNIISILDSHSGALLSSIGGYVRAHQTVWRDDGRALIVIGSDGTQRTYGIPQG